MTSPASVRAGGWLRSLAALVPVPVPYRSRDKGRDAARSMLRCDDDTLDMLIREGLPCDGPPGAERFDPYDVYNVGLYSGTGRSLPEYAALFVGRLATADPATWVSPASWRLRLRAACRAPHDPGTSPEWTVARPLPERYGGRVRYLAGQAPAVTATSVDVTSPGGQIELTWGVTTSGARRVAVSPVARELMRWVQDEFRFQSMPPALALCPQRLRELRTADCVGASVLIEHECQRLGIPARTERTMMLGVVTFLSHGRLVLTDDDGAQKALDPGLSAVCRIGRGRVEAFEEYCHGSTGNRMIPLPGSPADPLARHCGHAGCPASVDTHVSREG